MKFKVGDVVIGGSSGGEYVVKAATNEGLVEQYGLRRYDGMHFSVNEGHNYTLKTTEFGRGRKYHHVSLHEGDAWYCLDVVTFSGKRHALVVRRDKVRLMAEQDIHLGTIPEYLWGDYVEVKEDDDELPL